MILATHGIIQSKAAAAPPAGIITTGLVLYVDTENSSSYNGSVATWYDLSSSGNNAIATNSPTYNASEKAMYMSGGGAYFNLPNRTNFPTGAAARSIGGWYKMNVVNSDYMGLIYYGQSEQHNNFEIMTTGSKATFGLWNDDIQSSFTMSTGMWYNICITFNGTNIKIYVNGNTYANQMPGGGAVNTISNGGAIGLHANRTGAANMYNRMNYLYNFALTDQQVLDNFNNTKARFGL
jgi:hypothetical protein